MRNDSIEKFGMPMVDFVRQWVEKRDRSFRVYECARELKITESNDYANLRQIISRMVKSGELQRAGKRSGLYYKSQNHMNHTNHKNLNNHSRCDRFVLKMAHFVLGVIKRFRGAVHG